MPQISVLIADDHLLLRETLLQLLVRNDFEVVSAGTLTEALEKIAQKGSFDIVLLDVVMPGMNGIEGIEQAVKANAGGAVVVLSGNAPKRFVDEAIRSGARGFIPKTLSAETLSAALHLIHQGKIYLPVEHYSSDTIGGGSTGLPQLSPQETRVLRYLCEGMSNKEIAREMELTEITIKTHMRSVCAKLGAKNRTQAALMGNAYFNG